MTNPDLSPSLTSVESKAMIILDRVNIVRIDIKKNSPD